MKDLLRALVVVLFVTVIACGLGLALGRTSAPLFGAPASVVAAAFALALNWLVFIAAAIQRTERYYDATGSLTFLGVVAIAVAAAPTPSPARLVPAALVAIWALRLGTFLFARIRRAGEDRRFAAMRDRPMRFLVAWTLQGLWAFVTSAALLVLVASTARDDRITPAQIAGWLVWCIGFGIEVVADRQKQRFAANRENATRFISIGLWAWSRHPNYFGEILLWTGLFLSGVGIYQGAEWLCAVSPILVALLLVFVSGVPLLEKRADERFGNDPEYRAYKANTPVLVPRPPRR